MVGGWCLNAEPSLMKDSLRSARLWIRDGGGSPIVKMALLVGLRADVWASPSTIWLQSRMWFAMMSVDNHWMRLTTTMFAAGSNAILYLDKRAGGREFASLFYFQFSLLPPPHSIAHSPSLILQVIQLILLLTGLCLDTVSLAAEPPLMAPSTSTAPSTSLIGRVLIPAILVSPIP